MNFSMRSKITFFIIDHGRVHWLLDYPVYGWVLVPSRYHIESDNIKVKPPLFDPLPTRTATRGVSMTKLKDHAINSSGAKLANIYNNDENIEPQKKCQRVNKEKNIQNFKLTSICSTCIT